MVTFYVFEIDDRCASFHMIHGQLLLQKNYLQCSICFNAWRYPISYEEKTF